MVLLGGVQSLKQNTANEHCEDGLLYTNKQSYIYMYHVLSGQFTMCTCGLDGIYILDNLSLAEHEHR